MKLKIFFCALLVCSTVIGMGPQKRMLLDKRQQAEKDETNCCHGLLKIEERFGVDIDTQTEVEINCCWGAWKKTLKNEEESARFSAAVGAVFASATTGNIPLTALGATLGYVFAKIGWRQAEIEAKERRKPWKKID